MLINFSQTINNLDGEALKNDGDKDFTLKDVAIEALCRITEKTKGLSGTEKFHRGELARAINAGGEVDIPAEDVTKLKESIAEIYGPLVILQAWEMLDPKPKKADTGT